MREHDVADESPQTAVDQEKVKEAANQICQAILESMLANRHRQRRRKADDDEMGFAA